MPRSDDGTDFHFTMAGLLLLAVVTEKFADRIVPGFEPPGVGLLTLAAVAVWLGRTMLWQHERERQIRRRLEQRIAELEARSDRHEHELSARRAPIDPGRGSR